MNHLPIEQPERDEHWWPDYPLLPLPPPYLRPVPPYDRRFHLPHMPGDILWDDPYELV